MRANLFYTNPRVSALLVLFIVVLGGAAFAGLARQEDPKMAERYGMVVTFLPGATAQRMGRLPAAITPAAACALAAGR